MSVHVIPKRTYFLIFATLLVLTFVTVRVSYHEYGPWNTIIALGIAVTKATLVVLYFMHLRTSERLTKIVVLAGIFWFVILISLTLNDYLTRSWISIYFSNLQTKD